MGHKWEAGHVAPSKVAPYKLALGCVNLAPTQYHLQVQSPQNKEKLTGTELENQRAQD